MIIKQKEVVNRAFRDGECFVRFHNLGIDGEERITFLEPDLVDDAIASRTAIPRASEIEHNTNTSIMERIFSI